MDHFYTVESFTVSNTDARYEHVYITSGDDEICISKGIELTDLIEQLTAANQAFETRHKNRAEKERLRAWNLSVKSGLCP